MTSGARCSDELLEPVVAVDDATIQIVEIGRREAAAVERHERTQVRRNHRHDVQDHPLRLVAGLARIAGVAERVDDLEPLEQHLLAMLSISSRARAQRRRRGVDVETAQQLAHGRRTDVGQERDVVLFPRLRPEVQIFVFVQQLVGRTSCLPGSMTT